MATLRRRNNKWQVQVRIRNYGATSKTFINKKDALQWGREKEIELQRCAIKYKPRNFPVTGKLIEKYINNISIKKRGYEFEKYCFNNFLRTSFSNLPVNQISTKHLSEYRDLRLKKVKASTFIRELNLIRHFFNILKREWGYGIDNPCNNLTKPKVFQKRERRLSEYEYNYLIKGNYSQNILRNIIEIAIETGMRRGEILNIKKEHINRDTLLIPITKNGHQRIIPLTKRAKYILHKSKLPFSMSANAVRLAWERLKKKGNIKDLHFHDLRHEAISRFFEKGLSIPEVALISGHKDMRMLFRYTHLKAEDVLNKLNV